MLLQGLLWPVLLHVHLDTQPLDLGKANSLLLAHVSFTLTSTLIARSQLGFLTWAPDATPGLSSSVGAASACEGMTRRAAARPDAAIKEVVLLTMHSMLLAVLLLMAAALVCPRPLAPTAAAAAVALPLLLPWQRL